MAFYVCLCACSANTDGLPLTWQPEKSHLRWCHSVKVGYRYASRSATFSIGGIRLLLVRRRAVYGASRNCLQGNLRNLFSGANVIAFTSRHVRATMFTGRRFPIGEAFPVVHPHGIRVSSDAIFRFNLGRTSDCRVFAVRPI